MNNYKLLFILFLSSILFSFNSCKNNNEITNSTLQHYLLTLQPDSIKGKDALISYYSPNTNFGNHISMHPDCWTIGGNLDIIRGLIQFDLSSLPTGVSIDSAFLCFYFALDPLFSRTEHQGENYMLLQRIIEPWQENTVTWSNQPNVDVNHTVWINKFIDPRQDYTNIDVTNLVRDIIANNKNYGFMLRLSDETPYKITLIASSDNPDSSKHPKLVVYYTK